MKYSITMLETIAQDYINRDQIPDKNTRDLLLAIHAIGADGKSAYAQDMYSISLERINAIHEAAYNACVDSRTDVATAQQNLAPYAKSVREILENILLYIKNYSADRKNQIFKRVDFQKNLFEGFRRLEEFPQ